MENQIHWVQKMGPWVLTFRNWYNLCGSGGMNTLIKAAFVTNWTHYLWSRQLPNGQNCFDGVEFFVPPEDADIIFVYDMIEPYSWI